MKKTDSQKRKLEWFKKNEARLRHKQGCLTDCVAYILNMHPNNVPYFVYPREGWNVRLKKFFKKHGYEVQWQLGKTLPKRGTYIVTGPSRKWKTSYHAVVYKNGKLVYDPAYPGDWNDDRVTHILLMKKI